MLCMGEISPQLADNEAWVDQTFEKCDDILHRQVYLGQGRQEGLLVYVEVAVSNLMLEEHVIGLSDVQPLKSYEEGKAALLAGNGLLFLDGDTNCYKISSKGYPGLGVKKVRVVANKVRNEDDEAFIKERIPEEDLLGFIHYNPEVIDADRQGKSPYDCSETAVEEIKKIKEKLEA